MGCFTSIGTGGSGPGEATRPRVGASGAFGEAAMTRLDMRHVGGEAAKLAVEPLARCVHSF